MSTQLEVLGKSFVLTEVRETKDALKAKLFNDSDKLSLAVDESDGDLVKLLKPVLDYSVKVAFA